MLDDVENKIKMDNVIIGMMKKITKNKKSENLRL